MTFGRRQGLLLPAAGAQPPAATRPCARSACMHVPGSVFLCCGDLAWLHAAWLSTRPACFSVWQYVRTPLQPAQVKRMCMRRHSSGPHRQVTRMMPIGVPRVPYRTPQSGGWQWVDIWNCLVRLNFHLLYFCLILMLIAARPCGNNSSMDASAQHSISLSSKQAAQVVTWQAARWHGSTIEGSGSKTYS